MTSKTEPSQSDPDSGARESADSLDEPEEPGAAAPALPDVLVEALPGVEAHIFGEGASADDDRAIDAIWLRARLRDALVLLDAPVGRVTVLIVDDAHMSDLHRRHHGSAETTDVLTFPASEPGETIEADIAVCIDEALRQADRHGHPPGRELLLYALHGVLHCAGFDDHEPAGFRAMHAEEDRILRAIGVGAVFAPGAGGGGRA